MISGLRPGQVRAYSMRPSASSSAATRSCLGRPAIHSWVLLAAVGAADGADDQQPGAQRHQPRRLILSNLAFAVGDEVERETDQAEGGFGAIEGMETKAVGAKVLLEFLDAVFALGAAVVEAPGLHRVVVEGGDQNMERYSREPRAVYARAPVAVRAALRAPPPAGARPASHKPDSWSARLPDPWAKGVHC